MGSGKYTSSSQVEWESLRCYLPANDRVNCPCSPPRFGDSLNRFYGIDHSPWMDTICSRVFCPLFLIGLRKVDLIVFKIRSRTRKISVVRFTVGVETGEYNLRRSESSLLLFRNPKSLWNQVSGWDLEWSRYQDLSTDGRVRGQMGDSLPLLWLIKFPNNIPNFFWFTYQSHDTDIVYLSVIYCQ